METYDCVIVGGGASGILCAIELIKRLAGKRILLLERLGQLGQKIRATGNGRCNLSAATIGPENYHSSAPERMKELLARYSASDIHNYFEELGLPLRQLDDGIYPRSLRAESVLAVFDAHLKQVEIKTEHILEDFSTSGSTYQLTVRDLASNESTAILTKYLVLAGGGVAQPALGSDGSVLKILEGKDLTIVPPAPALAAVKVRKYPKQLSGVRLRCALNICTVDGTSLGTEAGEILFTKQGLSGIPVYQLSAACYQALFGGRNERQQYYRFQGPLSTVASETLGAQSQTDWEANLIARAKAGLTLAERMFATHTKVWAMLDFLPWLSEGEEESLWQKLSMALNGDLLTMLEALFPAALAKYLAKHSAFHVRQLRAWPFPIENVLSFESAQVMAGGVSLEELKSGTLELQSFPRVYLTGELLDVHGDSGGYNLHWAWLTALRAADEIVRSIKGE